MKEKKSCFVITPIGPAGSEIRRNADGVLNSVLRPVLGDFGYEVEAAHDISETGSIPDQVIKRVIESDLVVANLTTLNANVMYELAVRHCVAKPVISIVEIGTVLPFDIGNERTIFYSNDMAGVKELAEQLRKAVDSMAAIKKYDNPVTRVSLASVFDAPKGTESDRDALIFDAIQRLDGMVSNISNKINSNTLPTRFVFSDETGSSTIASAWQKDKFLSASQLAAKRGLTGFSSDNQDVKISVHGLDIGKKNKK